jgi:hypothetical protein
MDLLLSRIDMSTFFCSSSILPVSALTNGKDVDDLESANIGSEQVDSPVGQLTDSHDYEDDLHGDEESLDQAENDEHALYDTDEEDDEDDDGDKEKAVDMALPAGGYPPIGQDSLKVEPEGKQTIRWFGHGFYWTLAAVGLAWMGFAFAYLSRQSVTFAILQKPLYLSPIYNAVESIGLVQIKLCFNETETFLQADQLTGCNVVPLNHSTIGDNLFELTRIFVSLSVFFGGFFAVFLTTALFWETINLKPIVVGLLVTYFFQAFTMVFFDTKVCKDQSCTVGSGCIYCICATLCWISCCIATAKMDAIKYIATSRRTRRAEKKAKKTLKKAEQIRQMELLKRSLSTGTEKTTSEGTASEEESSLHSC